LELDGLGIDVEIVARLQGVLHLELERIVRAPLPSGGELQAAIERSPSLQRCDGENQCVAALGRGVGAKAVIAGNVGGLGDSYVINLKLVDATSGEELRRISEPLQGDAAQLIRAVRVAAFRIAAPERMRGAVAILTDVKGARVMLDNVVKGTTPLRSELRDVPVGNHVVRVTAPGYAAVSRELEVRFEKTTQLVIRLREPEPVLSVAPSPVPPPATEDRVGGWPRWMTRWWFPAGVGVLAVGTGIALGLLLRGAEVRDCRTDPTACAMGN
jgi:hypothetical protein